MNDRIDRDALMADLREGAVASAVSVEVAADGTGALYVTNWEDLLRARQVLHSHDSIAEIEDGPTSCVWSVVFRARGTQRGPVQPQPPSWDALLRGQRP